MNVSLYIKLFTLHMRKLKPKDIKVSGKGKLLGNLGLGFFDPGAMVFSTSYYSEGRLRSGACCIKECSGGDGKDKSNYHP
jgi:hypothetical protein